jgi:Protein of unknown function (DUF2442)
MLNRIVGVVPLPNYRLRVEFDDGISGTIDLSSELTGEIFEPLRDEALFRQAVVDEYGAICWPNGADLAPDTIYMELTEKLRAHSGAKSEPEDLEAERLRDPR